MLNANKIVPVQKTDPSDTLRNCSEDRQHQR